MDECAEPELTTAYPTETHLDVWDHLDGWNPEDTEAPCPKICSIGLSTRLDMKYHELSGGISFGRVLVDSVLTRVEKHRALDDATRGFQGRRCGERDRRKPNSGPVAPPGRWGNQPIRGRIRRYNFEYNDNRLSEDQTHQQRQRPQQQPVEPREDDLLGKYEATPPQSRPSGAKDPDSACGLLRSKVPLVGTWLSNGCDKIVKSNSSFRSQGVGRSLKPIPDLGFPLGRPVAAPGVVAPMMVP
ncbi:MAG: hypothetical protein M1816_007799 [Peltula sp. TS41687]|nr:MAG: hypothetical protein M1816_007799 [Peltula sp. TS41687]